jgi:hypothetical protein
MTEIAANVTSGLNPFGIKALGVDYKTVMVFEGFIDHLL